MSWSRRRSRSTYWKGSRRTPAGRYGPDTNSDNDIQQISRNSTGSWLLSSVQATGWYSSSNFLPVFQVFVCNSAKYSDLGQPFGYLKASTALNCVNLFVMPYNYPVLLPLLGETDGSLTQLTWTCEERNSSFSLQPVDTEVTKFFESSSRVFV